MKNNSKPKKVNGAPTKSSVNKPRRKRSAKRTMASLAVSNKSSSQPAALRSTGKETIVTHKEILKESVLNSTTFSILDTYAVQPAISVYNRGSPLGTWLPGIAVQYDNYEFTSLKFHYYTSASSLTSGTLIMSYDPNPDGSAPTSFSSMRNASKCVNGAVRENLVLDISDKVRGRKLLTRTAGVSALGLYDAGKVFIAATGGSDFAAVGYVEVEYSIRLSNPQTSPALSTDPTVYVPALPTYINKLATSNYAYQVGTTDGDSWAYCSDGLASGSAVSDPGYISVVSHTNAALVSLTADGCSYRLPTNTSRNVMQAAYPGRYSIKVQLNGNWEDLKLFCAVPIRLSPGNVSRCFMKTLTGNEYSCLDATVRGFTGTVISDPNPATDMPLEGEWEVNFNEPNTRFTIAVGVRTYNNVSASATFQPIAGCGPSYVIVKYLGPAL